MTTCLTFRDVPSVLRDELKRRAVANKRSLNAEGVTILTEALKPVARLSEKEIRKRLDAYPKNGPRMSVAEMRAAVREGRR